MGEGIGQDAFALQAEALAADEAGTFARITAFLDGLLEPLIERQRGRLVKLAGDGLLVEFASVADAVACAMAWQAAVADHEAAREPAERFTFRIGVNLGDVIVQGADLLGEGVNISARLEGFARAGQADSSDGGMRALMVNKARPYRARSGLGKLPFIFGHFE